jgi:hypothetical protein
MICSLSLTHTHLQSRDGGLLPIYQWLRCMFTPKIDVNSVGECVCREHVHMARAAVGGTVGEMHKR